MSGDCSMTIEELLRAAGERLILNKALLTESLELFDLLHEAQEIMTDDPDTNDTAVAMSKYTSIINKLPRLRLALRSTLTNT